jgi:hypothetical protein
MAIGRTPIQLQPMWSWMEHAQTLYRWQRLPSSGACWRQALSDGVQTKSGPERRLQRARSGRALVEDHPLDSNHVQCDDLSGRLQRAPRHR